MVHTIQENVSQPLNSQDLTKILFPVCHTIDMMLVWGTWY